MKIVYVPKTASTFFKYMKGYLALVVSENQQEQVTKVSFNSECTFSFKNHNIKELQIGDEVTQAGEVLQVLGMNQKGQILVEGEDDSVVWIDITGWKLYE